MDDRERRARNVYFIIGLGVMAWVFTFLLIVGTYLITKSLL